MPKVGNKEFPYTDKGRGQAEVYAAQTGQSVSSDKDSYGFGTEQGGGYMTIAPESHEAYKNLSPEDRMSLGMAMSDQLQERNSPKARLDHYLQPYVDEYLSAGEDEQKAYWLALIDVGVDPETKYHIAEDPEVKKMYEGLFQSNNINYLDVTHHRQSRKRLGLDSPHMDDAEEEQEQEAVGMQEGGQFIGPPEPEIPPNIFMTGEYYPGKMRDQKKQRLLAEAKARQQAPEEKMGEAVGYKRGGRVKKIGY